MAKKNKKQCSSGSTELIQFVRKVDISLLGGSILSIPFHQWRENMFFIGALDTELKQLTGSFPATFREDQITHPIFVLATSQSGHFICPCSTKSDSRQCRYIRQGCRLIGGRKCEMDCDSFLIEKCAFTLPLDKRFSSNLTFFGEVPASCIIDQRRKH